MDHQRARPATLPRLLDMSANRPTWFSLVHLRTGNEVYGGASSSAGIFLLRSSDDAAVEGKQLIVQGIMPRVVFGTRTSRG